MDKRPAELDDADRKPLDLGTAVIGLTEAQIRALPTVGGPIVKPGDPIEITIIGTILPIPPDDCAHMIWIDSRCFGCGMRR